VSLSHLRQHGSALHALSQVTYFGSSGHMRARRAFKAGELYFAQAETPPVAAAQAEVVQLYGLSQGRPVEYAAGSWAAGASFQFAEAASPALLSPTVSVKWRDQGKAGLPTVVRVTTHKRRQRSKGRGTAASGAQ
jgi:hypothetical protein